MKTLNLIFWILINECHFNSYLADVCDSDVDAAIQRLENPRFVFLVSGSKFWEFDREENRMVKEDTDLNLYWEEAPSSPNFGLAFDNKGYNYTFLKAPFYHIYACKRSTEECKLKDIMDLSDNRTKKRYKFDAGFAYFKGMPKPKGPDSLYSVHLFAQTEFREFDCRGFEKETIRTVVKLCDVRSLDVHKDKYPNFFLLDPLKEPIKAIEAFHNQASNTTDFFIAGPKYIKYTYNGHVKIIEKDVFFKCRSYRKLLRIALPLLLLLGLSGIMFVLILKTWEPTKTRRSSFYSFQSVKTTS